MKGFKKIKEKIDLELINTTAQKELKGGNNFFADGCPPPVDNPKLQ